jgi:hypothetical protein
MTIFLSFWSAFVAIIVLANSISALDPAMIWLSPRTISNDVREDFSAARGVWSEISTGAGSRSGGPVFHMDSKGLMWILGGFNKKNILNALWNYDPVEDKYRWVAGNATADSQYYNLGEKGVPGDDVFPGFLDFSAHAIDNNDNIWIYGSETAPNQNTFWMFNTTSLQFTWIGGDEANLAAIHGELGTASPDYWPGYLDGACMVVDSENNLWLISGYNGERSVNGVWHYNTTSRMWSLQHGDPSSTEQYPNFDTNFWPGRWAAGCTIDEEDRVWLFGGYARTPPNYGWNDMWSFDTKTVEWTVERGFDDSYFLGSVVSYNTYDTNNYPRGREMARMVDRRDGTIMMFGGFTRPGSSLGDIWVFDKTTKLWKIIFGNGNNATAVNSTFGEYREVGSKLGSRQDYSIEHGLTSNGNMIIFGGDNNDYLTFLNFNDIWVIPQDQCTTNLHKCDPNASCTMGTWTYQCKCNEGYTGNGKTCATTQSPSAQPLSSQSPASSAQPGSATPLKTTSGVSTTLAPFAFVVATLVLLV